MCRLYIHLATMEKSIQKTGKTHNHPSVRKSYSAGRKSISGRQKKEVSKSKTTSLTYFNNLKKKQQDQGGKTWCYTLSFYK